jgi:hypothetical protein
MTPSLAALLPLSIVLTTVASAAAIFTLRDDQVRLRGWVGMIGSAPPSRWSCCCSSACAPAAPSRPACLSCRAKTSC